MEGKQASYREGPEVRASGDIQSKKFSRKSVVVDKGAESVNLGSTFERAEDIQLPFNLANIEQEPEEIQEEDDNSDQEEVYLTDAQKYCVEAHCLMNSHGIGNSVDDAIHYYKTSIQLGEPKAMLAMANMNLTG